jgi:hypothetical protein
MLATLRAFSRRPVRFELARRLTLATVVSFVAFGVLAFALEDEETLAGPELSFTEDIDGDANLGTCPADFPIEVHIKLDHRADKNGDHIICTDERANRYVDNDFLGDGLGAALVTGHGNFFDGGKKILQDISFSFHGKNIGEGSKAFADAAKGEFEYHDQTGVGPDLTAHGDVLCLTVDGRRSRFIGVITRSSDKFLPLDALVVWEAEDNSEGADGIPDQVSRLSVIGSGQPKESCRFKLTDVPPLRPVASGNIQRH